MLAVTLTLAVQILDKPAQQQPGTSSATTSQQHPTQPITVREINQRQSEARCGTNKNQKACQKMSLSEWLSVGNNWIILCTIVLAGAALAQWELTRRTAKRQLRAYVMPEIASIHDYSTVKPPPPQVYRGHLGGIVYIKNSGQTPAYKLVHWGNVVIMPADMEHLLNPPVRLAEIAATTLGPGCTIHRAGWTELKVTPEQISAIRVGTSKVYVYGKVSYRDAFKRRRSSTYRLSYAGNYPPVDGATLSFCEKGNQSD